MFQLLERRSQENAETEYLERQILEHNKTVQAFVRGQSKCQCLLIHVLCMMLYVYMYKLSHWLHCLNFFVSGYV